MLPGMNAEQGRCLHCAFSSRKEEADAARSENAATYQVGIDPPAPDFTTELERALIVNGPAIGREHKRIDLRVCVERVQHSPVRPMVERAEEEEAVAVHL